MVNMEHQKTKTESKGVIINTDYEAFKVVTKKVTTELTEYDQYCLTEMLLIDSEGNKRVLGIKEIKMLKRNEHPEIKLIPASINYLKKRVLRSG